MVLKHKKEIEEVKKVNLQVDVFVKDGEVDEVKQSAMLGNQPMSRNEDDDVYECVGVYNRANSKVDVSFEMFSLGVVAGKEEATGGTHEKGVKFDALEFLDEPEKVNLLNGNELAKLRSITTGELRAIAVEAQEDDKPGWTAFQDAVIAILVHEKNFPAEGQVNNTTAVTGDHSDDADAVLDVGDYEFTTGDKYWAVCEYKVCEDKRELYRFTWEGVPVSFLDEPAE